MNGRTMARVVLVIVIALGAVALGTGAYQAGLAAGAQGGGTAVAPYVAYGWHPFGFGLFGFFGLFLFLFLLFALIRAATFGGRGRGWGGGPAGWGGPGRWDPDDGPRSSRERAFEEWHRRQHEVDSTGVPPNDRESITDR